jgi:hypothetical protein
MVEQACVVRAEPAEAPRTIYSIFILIFLIFSRCVRGARSVYFFSPRPRAPVATPDSGALRRQSSTPACGSRLRLGARAHHLPTWHLHADFGLYPRLPTRALRTIRDYGDRWREGGQHGRASRAPHRKLVQSGDQRAVRGRILNRIVSAPASRASARRLGPPAPCLNGSVSRARRSAWSAPRAMARATRRGRVAEHRCWPQRTPTRRMSTRRTQPRRC